MSNKSKYYCKIKNNNNLRSNLRFRERAVLSIEAEHIIEGYESIFGNKEQKREKLFDAFFLKFKNSSSILYRRLEDIIYTKIHKNKFISDRTNSTSENNEKKFKEYIKKIGKLYYNVRDYLIHIKHTDKYIIIDEDISCILYSCFCDAFEEYIQKKLSFNYFFKKKEETNNSKEYYFTLLGLLCFLCMGLEKDRAESLYKKFSFVKENEKIATLIKAIIEQYTLKKSNKLRAYEIVQDKYRKNKGIDKNNKTEDEDQVNQQEQYSEWNLIVDILDHIRKPIEHSPNYETVELQLANKNDNENQSQSKNKKIDQRTRNPYVMDNLIIKWINLKWTESTSDEESLELEFAITKQVARKIESYNGRADKVKITKVPEFIRIKNDNMIQQIQQEKDKQIIEKISIDEYFRINDMYWCRIKRLDDAPIDFKIHRVHLRRLVKKILKGENKNVIIKSMIDDIELVKKFDEEVKIKEKEKLSLKYSIPRSAKKLKEAMSLETKINKRIEYYDKLLSSKDNNINTNNEKLEESRKNAKKVHFILWAFQRPLWREKNNNIKSKLNKNQYKEISSALSQYSKYDGTEQSKKQVENAIANEYKYLKNYIKPSFIQTFFCVVESVKTELEKDRKNLLTYYDTYNETNKLSEERKFLFTKHALRFKRTQKEYHPCLQKIDINKKYYNDYRNIIWLSKNWGFYDEREIKQREYKYWKKENNGELKYFNDGYIEQSKEVVFDPKNYHSFLERNDNKLKCVKTREYIKNLENKERKKLYDALKCYENDRLLLEIANDAINIFNNDNNNSFLIKLGKNFDISSTDPKIEYSIKKEKCSEKIPLRYLAKISFCFSKKNFIKGMQLIKSESYDLFKNFIKIKKREEYGQMSDIEYFLQVILPAFKLFSVKIVEVLFNIEYNILYKCDNETIIDIDKRKKLIESGKEYFKFTCVMHLLKDNNIESIKYIRNNIAHEDLGDMFFDEKLENGIKQVDDLAKKLNCKTITEIMQEHIERKEKLMKEGIAKSQI